MDSRHDLCPTFDIGNLHGLVTEVFKHDKIIRDFEVKQVDCRDFGVISGLMFAILHPSLESLRIRVPPTGL